jgi:hypothetical protein
VDKKLKVTDVDGTVPGVAMLVSADLTLGEDAAPMHSVFVESERCPDPRQSCLNFWNSIRGDWPGHSISVIMNERARYLMYAARMTRMLGADSVEPPAEYVRSTTPSY